MQNLNAINIHDWGYERIMLQDWLDREVNYMENKDIERDYMFISVIQTIQKYFLYVQIQASTKVIMSYFHLIYVRKK